MRTFINKLYIADTDVLIPIFKYYILKIVNYAKLKILQEVLFQTQYGKHTYYSQVFTFVSGKTPQKI